MDYLRSGYSTTMYSFDPVSGLNVPFTATWYRAPKGATPLGVHHQYASGNYNNGVQYSEMVGEIIGQPRPWSNGATPPGLLGSNHCGTAWAGKLDRLTTPISDNPFDQPVCCATPAICEQILGTAPSFKAPDGTITVLRRLRISPTIYGTTPLSHGIQVGVLAQSALTCHGAARMRVCTVGPTPSFSIVEDWSLASVDTAFRDGIWYDSLMSPYFPGQTIEVLS